MLARVRIPFPLRLPAPAKYSLVFELSGTDARNDWAFWVFPATRDVGNVGHVHIARTLDAAALDRLDVGGTVLLLPDRATIKGNIPQCFTSIYWNAPYTDGGETHTLGLLCDPQHPVFSQFVTDFHSNWHWYELLVNARPMILDAWPRSCRPLVQLIDDWYQNRRLGVLVEATVGKGRLVICSMDIQNNLDSRPVVREFRKSLLAYMNRPDFAPACTVTPAQVQAIFQPRVH